MMLCRFLSPPLFYSERGEEVVSDRAVKEHGFLEDDGNPPPVLDERVLESLLPTESDFSGGRDRHQIEQPQEGRFPRSARSDDGVG